MHISIRRLQVFSSPTCLLLPNPQYVVFPTPELPALWGIPPLGQWQNSPFSHTTIHFLIVEPSYHQQASPLETPVLEQPSLGAISLVPKFCSHRHSLSFPLVVLQDERLRFRSYNSCPLLFPYPPNILHHNSRLDKYLLFAFYISIMEHFTLLCKD